MWAWKDRWPGPLGEPSPEPVWPRRLRTRVAVIGAPQLFVGGSQIKEITKTVQKMRQDFAQFSEKYIREFSALMLKLKS